MAWPALPPTRFPRRYTNVDYWRRQTGIDPLYTSAAFNPGSSSGPYMPVYVEEPFTLRRLGVFNGSTLTAANRASIGLFADQKGQRIRNAPASGPIAWAAPFERVGVSVWQWAVIVQGSLEISPGLYFIGYHQNDATSHVTQLCSEATTTFLALIGGIVEGVVFPVTSASGWGGLQGTFNFPILGMDGEA